jgi:phosphatidylserine/phosphatidylglycerophosphate/cardiolipin synthase-like enzyme
MRGRFAALFLALVLCASPPAHADEARIEDAFSPYQGATALVVRTIGRAHKTVRVAAYLLTSRPIANALIKAERKGVDVKVVIDQRQSDAMGSLAAFLVENGVATRKNGFYANMHDKFMVIDDDILELGSFNYTRTAEEQNAENVLVLHGAPDIVKAYLRQWNRLWDEAK